MEQKTTNIQSKENSLEIFLEDFTNHQRKVKANSKIKIDLPPMSFEERAIKAMAALKKQEPVTLSQARAQAISVKLWSGSRSSESKSEAIKYDLRMYFSELSEEQISDVLAKLYSIHNEPVI